MALCLCVSVVDREARAATAAITALVVHFGMYYGGITHYHNNPAVPATFALIASTLVMAAGVMMRSKD
jgi:hypothetical protein